MAETSQSYNTLRVVFEGELAILTLNRPGENDAISPEMILELATAFHEDPEISDDTCGLAIITGGEGVCAVWFVKGARCSRIRRRNKIG